jgi:hypothetical protein
VLARVRARVYRRRALGIGVVDVIGLWLRVGRRRLGAAKAIALPRRGSRLGLSTLNCF